MQRYDYDKSLKVGDLVTAYRKGYYIIEGLESREQEGANPLALLSKVLNGKFNKVGGRDSCDIFYCKRVTRDTLTEMREEFEANIYALEQALLEVEETITKEKKNV